jgi:hypothetical protein
MNKLLDKVKDQTSRDLYGVPYALLTDEQKLSLTDLIAYSFAREFATKKLQHIISNNLKS